MTRSIGSRMTFANVISPVALFVARGSSYTALRCMLYTCRAQTSRSRMS